MKWRALLLALGVLAAAITLALLLGGTPSPKRTLPIVCGHVCQHRRHWARTHPWHHRWNHLYRAERLWLRRVAWCESRNRPHINTGNGYYGLVQFDLRTAWAAGFRRRPDLTSWHQQAVRAVWWERRWGRSPWPVCG